MRLRQLAKAASAFASAALIGVPSVSSATLVSSGTNDPLTFDWNYDTGTSLLTGSGSMTVSGFDSSLLSVLITLNNTSSIGGQGGERLTSFGFGIDPNATSVAFVDPYDSTGMINAVLGQNFPGIQGIDVCAIGGKTCAGGSNGGVFAGTSDTFLVLLGGNWGDSVNIDPIGLKYQTGYGSFEFTSGGQSGTVPEPASASLVGLGLGMLAVGAARRRKPQA